MLLFLLFLVEAFEEPAQPQAIDTSASYEKANTRGSTTKKKSGNIAAVHVVLVVAVVYAAVRWSI